MTSPRSSACRDWDSSRHGRFAEELAGVGVEERRPLEPLAQPALLLCWPSPPCVQIRAPGGASRQGSSTPPATSITKLDLGVAEDRVRGAEQAGIDPWASFGSIADGNPEHLVATTCRALGALLSRSARRAWTPCPHHPPPMMPMPIAAIRPGSSRVRRAVARRRPGARAAGAFRA